MQPTGTPTALVKVEFYGEALCPFCRKFITQAWPQVWNDPDLQALVDYRMIPWGNAYFATQACGGTPFSHQTMACWYQHCVQSSADDDEECFAGQVIYQHGAAEGELNQWESCVDHEMGLDAAVEFAECVEGPNLDAYLPDVTALVESCLEDVTRVRDCVETRGKALEVANAKQTPQHPGVPWVLVDGQPVDDPLEIKTALCQALAQSARPPSCDDVEKDNGASLRYVN